MFGIGKVYFIICIALIIYLIMYWRRTQGAKIINLNLKWEAVLFPFSREGKASVASIILVIYVYISTPISYLIILINRYDLIIVAKNWFILLWIALFGASGIELVLGFKNVSRKKIGQIFMAGMGVVFLCFGILLTFSLIIQ